MTWTKHLELATDIPIYDEWVDAIYPLPVIIIYNAHAGSPGCFSGPPENCYPPDPPEIEIEAIILDIPTQNTLPTIPPNLWPPHLEEYLYDRLVDAATEYWRDSYELAHDYDPDYD